MFYVVPSDCQRLANISIQHRSCWTTFRLPTRSKEQPLVLLCTLLVWVQPAKSCAIKKQQKDVKGGKWLGNAWKLRMRIATSRSYMFIWLFYVILSVFRRVARSFLANGVSQAPRIFCRNATMKTPSSKWKHYEEGLQRNATAINSLYICGVLSSTVKVCEVASSLAGVCKAYHIARATRMTRPNIPNPLNHPACRGNSIVHLKRYNINQVPVNSNAS